MENVDNNFKMYFLSFADKRYSTKRIKNEALSANCFDEVIVENEDDFEEWYKLKYKNRFHDRGFGYWQWKSYRIRRLLEKMNEDDVLVYLDAGCHINISFNMLDVCRWGGQCAENQIVTIYK